MEKREEERKENEEIQLFVEKLVTESNYDLTENRDFNETVEGLKVAKTVKDKVNHFLQEAAAKK